MTSERAPLAGYFLGAHGEQRELFEDLLVAHVRDHFTWRARFHPEDRGTATDDRYPAYEARIRAELNRLAAALQRSVPVSSPRYLGHMTSDLLLPAVLAQLVTTLYNPNNVSTEVAPVTVGMERAAAAQLAEMVGFATAPNARVRGWGHLTGGGTVANIEALWIARAVRCWPVAVMRAARELGIPDLIEAAPRDEHEAFGLSVAEIHALNARVRALLAELPEVERRRIESAIEAHRIEHRGAHAYPPMHVLAPTTAHYSWKKAVRLLGLGDAQLHAVPVTERMRMDTTALAAAVGALHAAGEHVLAVVPVLGTTEYGTLDPVHEVVALRDARDARSRPFWVHVDAAWGGYFASMFRSTDGTLLPHDAVRSGFRWFPSRAVYDAVAGLGEADSVTVDPHKLGYVPYGVGALLLRDGRARHFVTQHAPYVFEPGAGDADEPGRYALEGSRPGAMAAAVYTAHHVLPLHSEAFGTLPAASIRANERLYARLLELGRSLEGVARVVVPYEPDTNLICIAVNPGDNRSVAAMNAFAARLYTEMSAANGASSREYFASRTRLALPQMTDDARTRLFAKLGITEVDAQDVFLLRHTLMNPVSRVDAYCDYLGQLIRHQL